MSDSPGIWSTIDLAGHACEIFEPAEPSPHGYVLVYLHGRSGHSLNGQQAFVDQFQQHRLRVICPRSGPSWWSDRIWPRFDAHISAERYVVDSVLGWIAERWRVEPPRVGLLGIGMGGQGALRIAFRHPNRFPVVAAITPAVDYQRLVNEGDEALFELYGDPESARQDTATLHVHPLNWPRNIWFCCDPADPEWFEGCDRLRMKLGALGIPFEADLETTSGGNRPEYANRLAGAAIEFLTRRLESERLRVV